jgi:hypothetical protein
MKIRKAIKMALVGTAVALPIASMAGTLGQFSTASSGPDTIISADTTITGGVGPTLTCATTQGSEDGFLQRSCTDGTNSYFQTIIYESGTEGVFSDANLVMTGSATGHGGIADVQVINDGAEFDTTVKIQADEVGDLELLGGDIININQNITDNGIASETFTNSFDYAEHLAGGIYLGIEQDLNNAQTGTWSDENIHQGFAHYELNALGAGESGAPGDVVTFAANDFLFTTLLNSDVPGLSTFGLQDFGDEDTGKEKGVDNLAATSPFYNVTYTSSGNDVFTYPAFP